jgi:cytochrome b561
MADQSPYTGTDDTNVGDDRGATTGTPRWVKAAGIAIVIVLLLLMIALHLTGTIGPGPHGGH